MSSRSEITLAEQFEKRKGWKSPLVDAVAATFLIRQKDGHGHSRDNSVLYGWEFLVTERVRGAEKGQFQAHHGGFMEVTDQDVYDSATREVREEIGYVLNPDSDIKYLVSIGPGIFRSKILLIDQCPVLTITEEEAEPSVGFALPLFIADVTGREPTSKTDGEVVNQNWMTPAEIIERFGGEHTPYSKFNYFQMFVHPLLYLSGVLQIGQRAISKPGTYHLNDIQ